MLSSQRDHRRDRDDSRERHRDSRDHRDRGRDSRDRRHSSPRGDLRDRLDRDRYSDIRVDPHHCDISPSASKSKLFFLEDKNPDKDFKGKENGDLEHLLENNRKAQKDLEKKLTSEWSEKKKKKKKRSKSRSKDRKPLTSKDSENRKRKLSPSKDGVESKHKKDKARSSSRSEKKKKKEKKSKKSRSPSTSEKQRSPSKTSSGSRKSRIDSGISVSTNFSKESLSISPRDNRQPSPIKENSNIKDESSPTDDVKHDNIDQSNKTVDTDIKENQHNDSKNSNSSSPSPIRRVLELSENVKSEDQEKQKDDDCKDKDKEKNEGKVDSKDRKRSRSRGRRSKSREHRRSRSRDRRTRSRDRHHRHRGERDLKDEIDEERRRRRRDYYRSDNRYARRSYHPHSRGRYSPRHSSRRSGSPDPTSWEDKVNSFLANTVNATPVNSSLVEITKSEILPTDFDPSKPPPGLSVIPPDYAIPAEESAEAEVAAPVVVSGAPIRMLTDVTTGQLIPQPMSSSSVPSTPVLDTSGAMFNNPPPLTTAPPPGYQGTQDITITAQPAPAQSLEQEIAALNALNQEREKNKKDDKPLTLKEKKKLEKSRKEIWQFVSKKLLSDPVFCNKVKKKKKEKGVEDLKEKAEKCAVRIGLKLEKSGFSETRLWLMFKDNEKGIVGFHDELSAAVANGTIETDLDARKPKDRVDAELLKDGTVFKYIGQYIQGNPTMGKISSNGEVIPSSGDLQSILDTVHSTTTSPVPPESDWEVAVKSFAPFKTYLTAQKVPPEVTEAYSLCLVLSGFTYTSLHTCVTNFQPPEPENPDEPPETVYGHLLNCLREISFEKYPPTITDNIDGHTISIVRFVLDHFSKPRSPTPPAVESRKTSPVPPADEGAVPTGGNTSCQLPRKKYVLVSVSVDTIPVENGQAIWQVNIQKNIL